MYEMYPDDWPGTPQPSTDGEQPRRRARQPHSVTPAILVRAEDRDTPAADLAPRVAAP